MKFHLPDQKVYQINSAVNRVISWTDFITFNDQQRLQSHILCNIEKEIHENNNHAPYTCKHPLNNILCGLISTKVTCLKHSYYCIMYWLHGTHLNLSFCISSEKNVPHNQNRISGVNPTNAMHVHVILVLDGFGR